MNGFSPVAGRRCRVNNNSCNPPIDEEPPARPGRPEPEPLVVDAKDLAVMLRIGLRSVRAWDAAGKLPRPLRISGRVLWRRAEIESWLVAGAPNRSEWEARKAASQK